MIITIHVPKFILERYKVGDYLALQHDCVNIHNWVLLRFYVVSIDLEAETLVAQLVEA
jgi:hypothetical protein